MKYAAILLSLLILSGCERSTSERTDDFILPEGLKHCRIYNLNSGISNIKVVQIALKRLRMKFAETLKFILNSQWKVGKIDYY